jgi:outer membrane protein OmpA-like peptidoglycan-associated protein
MSLVSLCLRLGVTEATGAVQATVSAGRAAGRRGAAALALAGLLGGCGFPKDVNPVTWWHNLEGGPIAAQRPPPPNATAPYPNLATVPPAPPPVDAAALKTMTDGLVADRANAEYAASLAPLPANPVPPRPAPVPPAPTGDDVSGATLPAVTAKPALSGPPQPPPQNGPMTKVKAAPVAKVEQAPLASPIPNPPEAPPAPAQVGSVSAAPKLTGTALIDAPQAQATPAAPLASLPPVPAAPPPPAALPGLPTSTLPTPAPVAPPPPPAPPKPAPADAPVLIAFPPGSSTLPVDALVSLKLLARQRGDNGIVITGYGDTDSADAVAQSAAMPLALARARAIAANLLAAGVPAPALRVTAQAQGQGGAARLTN